MWVRGCLQRCLGGLAIPAPSLLSAEHSITAQVQLRVCRPKSGVFNSRSPRTGTVPQCQKRCSAFSGAESRTAQVYTTRDSNALCIKPACLQKQSYTGSVTLRIVQVKQRETEWIQTLSETYGRLTANTKRIVYICSLNPAEVRERAREADIKIQQGDAIWRPVCITSPGALHTPKLRTELFFVP